ncbi:MAG: superfamily II RNA helicase, partial [Candidatus Omnitrophota bacterium]
PVKVVCENNRPVPLHFCFQCQDKVYGDFDALAKKGYNSPQIKYYKRNKVPRTIRLRKNELSTLINFLMTKNLLPCIYFAFSRKKTEAMVEDLESYQFLSNDEESTITKMYDELCVRYELVGEPSAQKLKRFVSRGIAYHHAGMLPTLKEVVEQLFTSRLIKLIFTTETFALGINMPARAVVFDEMRKYYGSGGFMRLRTRDLFQMAGRAGRRGIDDEGFVFCRVNPHDIGLEDVQKMIFSESEKVYSQFNTSYATILNLYQHYGEDLYDIYPSSLHYFQAKPELRKRALLFMRGKVDILKEFGHIEDGKLTEKGIFASQIYGYELLLAEVYAYGTLDKFSELQLALFCLGAVYEARKGKRKPVLSKRANEMESLVRKINQRIHRVEKIVGMAELSKKFYFHLSPAIEGWMNGLDFGEVFEMVDADEGELVRAFRMVIQMLNEIAKGPVTDQLKGRCYQLMRKINRDVINSEKQLRS